MSRWQGCLVFGFWVLFLPFRFWALLLGWLVDGLPSLVFFGFWFLGVLLLVLGCGVLLGPGGGPVGWFVVGVFGGVVAAGG